MARHLRVRGMVQGVGYRAAFCAQASTLRLCGWVRNRLDGSVEAMVAGTPAALEQITAWARRGPTAARVVDVAVSEVDDAMVPNKGIETLPTE
jgi:acylphosphatase